ncbi:SulP family inorganic anion transporter [Kalamiella sp. sgz302252]|uniref:SulP family inorganic anion transporter n=1 Tax=Pantoea sp. sgz302252 TaxID=3341827 RepID=UPI0036D401FC
MTLQTVRSDILAGTVVFLVALPLSLGIAQACGLPPFVGLLTGVVGGIVVTIFSPSRFAVSGPAAGLVTVVAGAMESLGSFSLLLSALVLAGALQLLAGFLRAGRWICLVPGSVIQGMMAAIGLLLILQQTPVALDTDGDSVTKIISPDSVLVALGALLILALWQTRFIKRSRFLGRIPGALMAVLWGSLMVLTNDYLVPGSLADLDRLSLPEIDSFSEVAAQFSHPEFSAFWRNGAVWLTAVTLALVASLETLLSQEALQKLCPQQPQPSADKELLAQGVGNMLSGCLGGLPITAVIVRSSVNVNAGARSKFSVLLHGLLLFCCGLFFETLLNTIPLASLAAILMYTGYRLAHPELFLRQWRLGAVQFIPFIVTASAIVLTGMLTGLALGMLSQLLCSTCASHRSAIQLSSYSNHFVIRFNQNLTFLHNARLRDLLAKIPDNSVVIAEYESAEYMDRDIWLTLAAFSEAAAARGIMLERWPRAEDPQLVDGGVH